MDPSSAHLFLNHIPVVGGLGVLLLLAWGLMRRSVDVTLAALVGFVLVGLMAVPVFLTGRSAEGRLSAELRPRLERHEEAAIAAMVGLEAAASVAAVALFVWQTTRRYPAFPATATLILGLAASILIGRAASLGNQIAHPETRQSP